MCKRANERNDRKRYKNCFGKFSRCNYKYFINNGTVIERDNELVNGSSKNIHI